MWWLVPTILTQRKHREEDQCKSAAIQVYMARCRQVWAIQQDTVSNKTKNEAKKQNKIPKKLTINTQNDTNTQAHTDVCTHTNTHIYTNTHKHINAHKYKHMCTHTLKEALFL